MAAGPWPADHRLMPRRLELTDDGLSLSFTGFLRLLTLRRRLVVPWSAVRDVRAGAYEGGAVHGRFRRSGRWQFLSFEDPERVVRLHLDRRARGAQGFDEVVVGDRDPSRLAEAIAARAGLSSAAHAA
jgi:hypothetical protein